MLEPTAAERAWSAVGAGLLAIAGAARRGAAARRAALGSRWPARASSTIALAFLAAGVPDELLRPDQLGRAGLRHRARHQRAAGRARALPRHRPVDPDRDPARRHDADRARGAAAFWPRRAATGFPFAALVLLVTLYAVPGGRARLRGRVPARRAAGAARARVPAARAPAPDRGRRGRGARRRDGDRGADRGARARRRRAVVGLRDVGALDRLVEVDDVLLGPRLRPARLAARRPRDAAREGQAGRLLEGREPRHLRRRALDPVADRHARGDRRTSCPTTRRSADRFTQPIKVTVRNLRTRTFVTAGIPVDAPEMPNRAAIPNGPPGI